MSDSKSQEKTYEILKWLNKNRHQVLELYKNEYIAYNEKGIISHSENLSEVMESADASGEEYVIYLVPPRRQSVQIL
ncbi:MAG TPA: hypothetical protein DCF68_07815 [Cyanothece sp. UBA12306]|nr:hypothetical protein [Cyanothece sp. UBA12306]